MDAREYSVSSSRLGDAFSVRAFFHKELPFAVPLQRIDSGVVFGGQRVTAFGMAYMDHHLTDRMQILYYKDDHEFVLRLVPEAANEELLLARGLAPAPDLNGLLRQLNALIAKGRQEAAKPAAQWKFGWTQYDFLAIPDIAFNITAHYTGLEGQRFFAGAGPFRVSEAWQRTAFVLNERGAIVESEATVTTAVDSVAAPGMQPHPKRFVFDKPFVVVLRHNEKRPPYFVLHVQHPELMKPFK